MWQSVEEESMAQSAYDDNDAGLAQVLAEVLEEVRQSIDRDINGADLLHSLLSAPWLYSLLRVYECLVQHSQDAPNPYLPYSTRLSQEITASVRGLPAPSSDAQELYILLKSPHMQALLSAHDSVAQRDYGPVLPPLPDNLSDNEEAVRIVCLVKNKQPLAHKLPRYQSTGSCNLCCQTAHLSGGGLNLSAPAVYNSLIVENCGNGVESIVEGQWHPCTSCTASSRVYPCSCCPPGCSLYSQTAPSSPMLQRHHSIDVTCSSHPALRFKRQHSLDELRSTVHTVANIMDTSTSDARHLRQKMVAVTEKMTDNMEENAQALSLLVEVVDKLQGLIIANKSPEVSHAPKPQHDGVSNWPGQPIVQTRRSCSNAPCISSSFSSSSSSSLSSFSSSFQMCNVEGSCEATQCRSLSNQTRNKFGNKTEQTPLSNGLTASSPNDDCDAILCLSSKKKKSKMRK
nr:uncharacterized protein mpp4a isoform X4 [Danio rerio]XP_021334533.1 uncharacterized protein mpp4a isoform X4 [Danio rerio]|eukprot:XP_021327815.1 uncharacterized protein mpp4a isoform X4 [Danio rerio]